MFQAEKQRDKLLCKGEKCSNPFWIKKNANEMRKKQKQKQQNPNQHLISIYVNK